MRTPRNIAKLYIRAAVGILSPTSNLVQPQINAKIHFSCKLINFRHSGVQIALIYHVFQLVVEMY